ncbi:MAG: TIR domain-containing protein [bacterium]
MPDIFISYSSHDRMLALELAEKLRAAGYEPWIDQHGIGGATRWGKEIVQAINAAKLVAVLISSSSLLSDNVVKELNLSAQKKKHLLPIMLEETELTEEFAYHLTGLHRVNIDDTNSILDALERLDIRSSLSRQTIIHPTSSSKDIRLAVLPFDDLSPLHDNEWFADGMLDELITTLGALEHMKVPSRTDVMYYKKHHPKAQEIASDLNVRYLVGGSVRKAGDKIRINASLTDAFTNQQLWTNHYDGSFDDVFDLQERVSKEITGTLRLRLTPPEKQKIEARPTNNPDAYEYYLRGLESQRKLTKEGYEQAVTLFEKAIEVDPTYVDAYLSIANVSGAYYRQCSRAPKWLGVADKNLEKAESLSGTTGKTLWIRGELAWLRDELEEAESLLIQATRLNPYHAQTFDILGHIYFQQHKFENAATAFEEFLQLNNDPIAYNNLLLSISRIPDPARLLVTAKRAMKEIQKHLNRQPDAPILKLFYAYSLFWAEQNEDARVVAEELLNHPEIDANVLYNLGSLYDDLGDSAMYIELTRRSIDKGFRGIDGLRGQKFNDPELQKQISELTHFLERKIEEETNND